MWNWVPSVNLTSEVNDLSPSSEAAISGGHTLNTGIYIDTLVLVLKVSNYSYIVFYVLIYRYFYHHIIV